MSKKQLSEAEGAEKAIRPSATAPVFNSDAYKRVIFERMGEVPSKFLPALEVIVDELAKLQTK